MGLFRAKEKLKEVKAAAKMNRMEMRFIQSAFMVNRRLDFFSPQHFKDNAGLLK